ncbi:MAG TPA: hypothetical protein VH854_03690 [Thermoanaerobaculia bacterium]|nr:hypothetical protein [Thermoanaerobaculia bacterium]
MRSAVLAILGLLVLSAARGEIVDRIAATVNDAAIPESEVRRAMLVSALEPAPDETREAFRERVIDALIDQYLEYQDAVRFGPASPDAAEVTAAMDKLRENLHKQGKSPEEEFAHAGMTSEDVRSALERQLVISRYLKERFAPLAYADETQARQEYEKQYVPERRAAGQPVEPFEAVADQMRDRYSKRAFDEEVAKWLKDLRQRSRISIYRLPVEIPRDRRPVIVSSVPNPAPTPAP